MYFISSVLVLPYRKKIKATKISQPTKLKKKKPKQNPHISIWDMFNKNKER